MDGYRVLRSCPSLRLLPPSPFIYPPIHLLVPLSSYLASLPSPHLLPSPPRLPFSLTGQGPQEGRLPLCRLPALQDLLPSGFPFAPLCLNRVTECRSAHCDAPCKFKGAFKAPCKALTHWPARSSGQRQWTGDALSSRNNKQTVGRICFHGTT